MEMQGNTRTIFNGKLSAFRYIAAIGLLLLLANLNLYSRILPTFRLWVTGRVNG
jgi:hypothetical protein